MTTPRELVDELATIQRALAEGTAFVVGLDNADRARLLGNTIRYSPLRTLMENAQKAAERVVEALTQIDPAAGELWRDGGTTTEVRDVPTQNDRA